MYCGRLSEHNLTWIWVPSWEHHLRSGSVGQQLFNFNLRIQTPRESMPEAQVLITKH